jgi:hypothetical protein
MKVSLDATRFLHLFLLVLFTIMGGYILVDRFDWNGLSAYSFSGTVVCQINNVLLKLQNGDFEDLFGNHSSSPAVEGDGKTERLQGNPKKKKNKEQRKQE